MQDYSYSIQKTGNKVEIKGSVYVPRVDVTVTHEKVFYYAPEDRNPLFDDVSTKLSKAIVTFKEELKEKVASVIKEHKEELTDDEAMIDKLQSEVKSLKKSLTKTEEELKEAKETIRRLELERNGTQPLPYVPWTNPNPWATGITWNTEIGDEPDWMNKNTITCENMAHLDYKSDASNGIGITYDTEKRDVEDFLEGKCRYHNSKNKKRNGGER